MDTPMSYNTGSQESFARPVLAEERIKTIDIIRGVALLGILMMNIPGFGFEWSRNYWLLRGPHSGADFYTLETISVFFEGTMRGLFSMLFGAGMILFTMNKKETPGSATVVELYYRRLLWLVLFGILNAYVLLWFGDILYFYGLCGMVLYPFRKAAAKWLLVLGIACICIGMLKQYLSYKEERQVRLDYVEAVAAKKEGKKLTDEQKGAKTAWMEREKWKPDSVWVNYRVNKIQHGSYPQIFNFFSPWNADGETWGFYHWLFWDGLAMMFIGMALFRTGFFSNKLSTSTYLMCLLAGYGIGITVGWIIFKKGDLGQVNLAAYLDRYRVNHALLYDIKRVFLSVGHASLILLVFRSRIVPWLMKALSNVGQMAFSNYLMQSIICTLYFYGYGFGNYDHLRYHQLYYVVFAVWIFQLIFSSIWLRYFRFGPFEWLWRSLTYWKMQPMKK
ncbi:MAG TPA: DUF418 domain-containing protein [Ferruginibacter sp.]|nr:DUF418 domain-containing protein [Ferruginibacter sp.]